LVPVFVLLLEHGIGCCLNGFNGKVVGGAFLSSG